MRERTDEFDLFVVATYGIARGMDPEPAIEVAREVCAHMRNDPDFDMLASARDVMRFFDEVRWNLLGEEA